VTDLPPVEAEDDMAYIGHEGRRENHQRVRDALEHDRELRYLRTAQERITQLKEHAALLAEESASLREAAIGNTAKAGEAQQEAAKLGKQLRPLIRADGSYKGFHVEWGFDIPGIGREWKSPKRRLAEHLAQEKDYQEQTRDTRLRESTEAWFAADVRAKEARQAAAERERVEVDLRLMAEMFGSNATLKDAEQILQNSVRHELQQVMPEDVFADYEAGRLDAEEAKRAFELMGAEAYILVVEQQERDVGVEM
jgi:hypothetical protein